MSPLFYALLLNRLIRWLKKYTRRACEISGFQILKITATSFPLVQLKKSEVRAEGLERRISFKRMEKDQQTFRNNWHAQGRTNPYTSYLNFFFTFGII